MTEKTVITSIRNRTGLIELNRPLALNALNQEMVEAITQALLAWRDDDAVEQVLVTSDHPKAFCAGGDIRAVREAILDGKMDLVWKYFEQEYQLNALIANYPKPYIAVVDGVVMGGGLGISAHGSHLIVTENAFASMPEMAIGYFTDVGLAYRSQRMVGTRGQASPELAKYWGITGYRMYAADMLYTGLAQGMVDNAKAYIEEVIDKGVANVAVITEHQPAPLADKVEEIEAAFAHSTWEEILKNSTPRLRDELEEYTQAASPTSIVAALALYDFEATAPTIQAALEAEIRLCKYMLNRPDFPEGVRAVLIDKNRDAAFSPSTVAGVDRKAVEQAIRP